MTHMLFDFASALAEACAILEKQRGQPVGPDVEQLIAQRLIHTAATSTEADRDKIITAALAELLFEETSVGWC